MVFSGRPICTHINPMSYFMQIYANIPFANPKHRFS